MQVPVVSMNFHLLSVLLLALALPAQGADVPAPDGGASAPAAPATEQVPDVAPPALQLPPERAETRRARVLEEQLKQLDRDDEVLWLGEGNERFLALYRRDSSGRPFANLLLLHDNLQHPDWPGIVQGLREEMSRHGWHTLSIAVPDYLRLPKLPPLPAPAPEPAPVPAPEDSTDNKEKEGETPATETPAEPQPAEPAEDASVTPVEEAAPEPQVEYDPEQVPEVLRTRILTALDLLRQKESAPVVVVAVGTAAGLGALSGTLQTQDIAGLVLIDPAPVADQTNLEALLLPIPVLDIVPQLGPRAEPEVRRAHARRLRHEQYEQRIIDAARRDFTGLERHVVRLVRGWARRQFEPGKPGK